MGRSAIYRQLHGDPDVEIIKSTHDELDLCDHSSVHEYMKSERPDEVILAAQRRVASTAIRPIVLGLFIKTYKFKIMSSMLRKQMMFRNYFF